MDPIYDTILFSVILVVLTLIMTLLCFGFWAEGKKSNYYTTTSTYQKAVEYSLVSACLFLLGFCLYIGSIALLVFGKERDFKNQRALWTIVVSGIMVFFCTLLFITCLVLSLIGVNNASKFSGGDSYANYFSTFSYLWFAGSIFLALVSIVEIFLIGIDYFDEKKFIDSQRPLSI